MFSSARLQHRQLLKVDGLGVCVTVIVTFAGIRLHSVDKGRVSTGQDVDIVSVCVSRVAEGPWDDRVRRETMGGGSRGTYVSSFVDMVTLMGAAVLVGWEIGESVNFDFVLFGVYIQVYELVERMPVSQEVLVATGLRNSV